MISREKIRKIKALVPDQRAMRQARDRWDKVAMPLDGLGTLQEDLIRMAGILGNADHLLEAPRLLVMCADNGIVAEGVSQTGQEVTALVADSIACGESPSAIFAARCDCQLRVVDVGMACDARDPSVICAKVARGSRNFAQSWSSGRTEEERGLFAQNIAEIFQEFIPFMKAVFLIKRSQIIQLEIYGGGIASLGKTVGYIRITLIFKKTAVRKQSCFIRIGIRSVYPKPGSVIQFIFIRSHA